jgi:hypothetical protein
LVVDAAGAGADPFFSEELHRGLEEVHHQPPVAAVQLVEGRDGARIVDSLPSHQAADMGPVLLLDVGVVVLLVGPAPGELDLVLLAEADDVVVDELAPIVGVQTPQLKRELLLDVIQSM